MRSLVLMLAALGLLLSLAVLGAGLLAPERLDAGIGALALEEVRQSDVVRAAAAEDAPGLLVRLLDRDAVEARIDRAVERVLAACQPDCTVRLGSARISVSLGEGRLPAVIAERYGAAQADLRRNAMLFAALLALGCAVLAGLAVGRRGRAGLLVATAVALTLGTVLMALWLMLGVGWALAMVSGASGLWLTAGTGCVVAVVLVDVTVTGGQIVGAIVEAIGAAVAAILGALSALIPS